MSRESDSTVSTTSLVFERIDERLKRPRDVGDKDEGNPADDSDDLETGPFLDDGIDSASLGGRRMDRNLRKLLLIAAALFVAGWLVGLFAYLSSQSYKHASTFEHDPQATAWRGSGKKVDLDQIMTGYWSARSHSIGWIAGPEGEDGLLLEEGAAGRDYLVVEDVRAKNPDRATAASVQKNSRTLMKNQTFAYNGTQYIPSRVRPSKNLAKVLMATDMKSNWRHSSVATYWILDVESQQVQPLVPDEAGARVQLAQWSPKSNAVVFTRDNNMFIRHIGSNNVIQFTDDGGSDVFNGVPDWVYEEEVFASASATWWSEDGNYVAFLRTNETGVPEFPIQYFVSRPSGEKARPGAEAYPEVRQLKYPKAGAHNPIVDLKFYDVIRGDVFQVDISGGFAADDRLITTVVWAGKQVLTKETNRVSDVMRVALVDVIARTGKTVRTVDVDAMDGGWFEISQKTTFIPADKAKGRPHDGYVDTIIHDDGDHLAYFTPLDSPEPTMLTSGKWEVVEAPSAVDLDKNLVYFVATKQSSIQRHVYQVQLTGQDMKPVTDTAKEGYYDMSFSTGAGYGLVSYRGPGVPWQKVISTPSKADRYEHMIEKNEELAERAKKHELPIKIYGTIRVDGVELNYVERRPPHFDERKKYPVLFQQYSGPGSQSVDKRFAVDFQSYVAAGLGYICVTVDGRGTGFIGRANRVLVRKQLGKWEARDQISAAKMWAAKEYVDESRLAIWGWSYGGFQTLKTLEQDAGQTFRYGMAVAPVTDWCFYDSIYTERYMLTPQANAEGYDGTAITNATALGQNVRFLLAHGVADDNVHIQNSLALLDRLNMAGVENYDVHVFPDSDHSIYFHNANRIVYDKLTNWIINAFNGEWLKVAQPSPMRAREEARR